MPIVSLIALILLLIAITIWLCIYLLYLRIKATPHDFHLKCSHAAPRHRVHLEIYRSQVDDSPKWNSTGWNN